MKPRLVVELLIGLGLIIAIGFAFIQTQNLTNTEATLEAAQAAGTEVGQAATEQADQGTAAAERAAESLDSAQATATQAAQEAADTQATLEAQGTERASEAQEDATQAAIELESAQETATSAAERAAESLDFAQATATQAAEESADTQATATQAAQEAADAQATLEAQGTLVAEGAAADATQAAGDFADVAATATTGAERSGVRATQAARDLAVIESFSATQGAELDAANASSDSLQATIDANVNLSGEGVLGESATLPQGYIRVRGEGFELGLPDRFDGAELSGNTFAFFALLNSLDLSETTRYLREQGDELLFFGIDTDLVKGVPAATVSIIREEPLTSDLPLEDYLALAYDPLPEGYSLVTRDVVRVNGRPAGRVILNGQLIAADIFIVQYVFVVEGDFWLVTFSGPASNFEMLRPVIEASIQTFRVR